MPGPLSSPPRGAKGCGCFKLNTLIHWGLEAAGSFHVLIFYKDPILLNCTRKKRRRRKKKTLCNSLSAWKHFEERIGGQIFPELADGLKLLVFVSLDSWEFALRPKPIKYDNYLIHVCVGFVIHCVMTIVKGFLFFSPHLQNASAWQPLWLCFWFRGLRLLITAPQGFLAHFLVVQYVLWFVSVSLLWQGFPDVGISAELSAMWWNPQPRCCFHNY